MNAIETGMVEIIVALDGTGDCTTVGKALEKAAGNRGKKIRIVVKKGVYREKLIICQDQITMEGFGDGETVISYGDYALELLPGGEKRGTFRTATVMVDASDFTARGITFENSAGPGEKVGQALALYVDGDRNSFENCRILGHQDTLFIAPLPPSAIEKDGFKGPKEFAPRIMGRHYYYKCRICGEVDFIFGGGTAWFEDCDIVSLETGRKINGYITAASTLQGEAYGFVFRHCRFIGSCRENSVFLGRPWREYAKVVIMESELGKHIRKEGWDDWGKEIAHTTAYYREYHNTGEGARGARVSWAGQLSEAEAQCYSRDRVLGRERLRNREKTMNRDILQMACRLADTLMAEYPVIISKRWDYTEGLVLSGMEALAETTGKEEYFEYVKSYYDYFILPDGRIRDFDPENQNIDHINNGKNLFSLLKKTGEERFLKAIEFLAEQLRTQPKTESGAYWHKKIYPNQIWLDGLFMGEPFQAQYAAEFRHPERFDMVAQQFRIAERSTYEKRCGLYVHACDESRRAFWADPLTGRSLNVWGRACGWYGMALVDSLDHIPAERKDIRKELIGFLNKLMDGVAGYQDAEGVWYQVLDNRRCDNYQEATCSCQFAYILEKGIRKGYLKKEPYRRILDKALKGIYRVFWEERDGRVYIKNCCVVAGLGPDKASGRDGTLDYYFREPRRDNDFKAVGPFLLMASKYV